ncbi:MAG TPA: hypothetical protein VKT30_08960 [Caulobacteraceae bacterium]|nr:hypothetical protein [Caulobacteraceae bacterium]
MRRIASWLVLVSAAFLVGASPPGGGQEVHRPLLVVPQSTPTPPGLRGFQTPSPLAPRSAARPTRITLASLAARSASPPTTVVPAQSDAHACRISCARPYYFCLAGDNGARCADSWSRCVAGCDGPTLSEGAAGR